MSSVKGAASPEALQRLMEEFMPKDEPTQQAPSRNNGHRFDVAGYLSKYDIKVKKTKHHGNSTLFILDKCVFDESHSGGEASIGQTAEGKLFYQCYHNSCQGKTWHDARQIISGGDRIGDAPESWNGNTRTYSAGTNQKKNIAPRPFKLVHISQTKITAPIFLIEDYLEADTLAVIFGDPESGKSFLAIDIACCVATGTAFHGRTVENGPIVYIAGEGNNALSRRFAAWAILGFGIRRNANLAQTRAQRGFTPLNEIQRVSTKSGRFRGDFRESGSASAFLYLVFSVCLRYRQGFRCA